MNIQQEEDAIERLPAEKYNTRNLVVAISVLASVVATIWGMDRSSLVRSNDQKQVVIEQQKKDKEILNKSNVDCEKENARIRDSIRAEQVAYERKMRAESEELLRSVMATERAVKKAIK